MWRSLIILYIQVFSDIKGQNRIEIAYVT